MDGADGWEWPLLLLIFSFYPDTWEGERAAVQEWTDTYLALQTGNRRLLARVRAMYVQLHLDMRNGDIP